MLTSSSGDLINYPDFARSLDVSQPTIKKYFEIADGTFIWRTLNTYTKNIKKTVIKIPKGHFRDTGLLCFLLNINTVDQLKNHPQFGRIWESFVIEHLINIGKLHFSKLNFYFYRTKAKAEIDLILEGRFGVIPVEIKSGTNTSQKQILTIKNFVKENNCTLGIVINRGDNIKLLGEKVIQMSVGFI